MRSLKVAAAGFKDPNESVTGGVYEGRASSFPAVLG